MSFEKLSHTHAMDLTSLNNVVILDVRDKEAYQKGHIPNAIHFSMEELNKFSNSEDKNSPILVYCYHGMSSQAVAQHLVDQDFLKVYSLDGGFEAWQAHYPVETSSAK